VIFGFPLRPWSPLYVHSLLFPSLVFLTSL
jgi:hypothetical protein